MRAFPKNYPMRKRSFLIILAVVFVTCESSKIVFAQTSMLQVENVNPRVVRISGLSDAMYSPSGKFLALQGASKFVVFPSHDLGKSHNLGKSIDDLKKIHEWNGKIIGFFPDGSLIYFNNNGVFTLDLIKEKAEKIFIPAVGKYLTEDFDLRSNSIVIASKDLIITGDGSYDWGGKMGNIFRYDLKRRRMTKGARIPMFWYASLSPSAKYILYEHGAEDNNNTELYDVRENKNYSISDYFNFKKTLPELENTDEVPVAWLDDKDLFLAQISPQGDGYGSSTNEWLVLFDVPGRKIIWKRPLEKWFFPTHFQQLDNNKGLFVVDDSVYELSLTDGNSRKLSDIDGKSIAASPDGKTIAFVMTNQLFVSSPDGRGKKLLCDIPLDWKAQTAYKAMGERPPLWSENGDMVILFGENQLLFAQVQANGTKNYH